MSETVKAASLILDFTIYPRTQVDEQRVRRFVEALQAGRRLPAVVADRRTRRVVDGFHRIRAVLRFIGAEADIEVVWEDYPGEAEMFLAAIEFNANHGLPLNSYDRAHCIEFARQLDVPAEQLADVLSLTTAKLAEIRERRFASNAAGQRVLLKGSTRHLAGRTLTPRQEKAVRHAPGQRLSFLVEQLIAALDGDLVNWSEVDIYQRLDRLHQILGRHLEKHRSKATV